MTKIASIPPAACASCFQAGPELRYVDFDAAYDGPVLRHPDGRAQPIDDLVICERCLQEAFDILDPQGMRNELDRTTATLEAAGKDIAKKENMILRLERTLAELCENPLGAKRIGAGGTGAYAGVPDDIREILNERRRTRKEYQERDKKAAKTRAAKVA